MRNIVILFLLATCCLFLPGCKNNVPALNTSQRDSTVNSAISEAQDNDAIDTSTLNEVQGSDMVDTSALNKVRNEDGIYLVSSPVPRDKTDPLVVIYNKVKETEFTDVELVDLDYDRNNNVIPMVGDLGFGVRDVLLNSKGQMSQFSLQYKSTGGGKIVVVFVEIPGDVELDKNILQVYINYDVDSATYCVGNVLVNVIATNIDSDSLSARVFNEEIVKALS